MRDQDKPVEKTEKVYLVTGWSSVFMEPGFEYEFKTIEEAKDKAVELLKKNAQTSLRIYKATRIYSGHRSNGDKGFVFRKGV